MSHPSPHIIEFPTFQNKGSFLSVGQFDQHIPFAPARIYWTYGNDAESNRGNHYHPDSERVVICMNGSMNLVIEDLSGNAYAFELNNQNIGVYIPKNHWITMKMSADSLLLAIASTNYTEGESIGDYSKFESLKNG